jgi:hypothetical protein
MHHLEQTMGLSHETILSVLMLHRSCHSQTAQLNHKVRLPNHIMHRKPERSPNHQHSPKASDNFKVCHGQYLYLGEQEL